MTRKSILIIASVLVLIITAVLIWWLCCRGTEVSVEVTARLGRDPLKGAVVTIGDDEMATDADGKAAFRVRCFNGDTIHVLAVWGGDTLSKSHRITGADLEWGSVKMKWFRFNEPAPPRTAVLIVQSPQSPGVSLEVNDEPRGELPATLALTQGDTVRLLLTKPQFRRLEKTLVLSRDTTRLNLAMQPMSSTIREPRREPVRIGVLAVDSDPPGARVRIDTIEGRTPFQTPLPYGTYDVEVTYLGQVRNLPAVVVNKPRVQLPIVVFEVPTLASLELVTSPPGAKVYIDDVDRGRVTPDTFHLSPGEHTIRVEQRGEEETRSITIAPGQNTRFIPFRTFLRDIERLYKAEEWTELLRKLPATDFSEYAQEDRRAAEFYLAVAQYNSGDFEGSVKTLERHIASVGRTSPHAYYFLGLALEEQGEWARAIEHYRRVESLRAKLPRDQEWEIMGNAEFGVASCEYKNYLAMFEGEGARGDAELGFQKEVAETALQEYVDRYCGDNREHRRCEKAREILSRLLQ